MKKKNIYIIIGVIIFILMLVPIPLTSLDDGGTKEYRAILYSVTKYHKLNLISEKGYDDGWKIKILGIKIYDRINTTDSNEYKINEIVSCLENELDAYLVTEQNNLVDIPLLDINNVNEDNIEIFKGKYASNNKDNMYFIVYPKNGLYEYEEMINFGKYFNEKFSEYQTYTDLVVPTIYIHTKNNDIELRNIANKCIKNDENKGKSLSSNTIKKINKTDKIVIYSGNKELDEIKDLNKIKEIINTFKSAKRYNDTCFLDGHSFEFKLYNDNELIDTIEVWDDGKRIIPKSMDDCYYKITNNIDLRKIIEEETNYVFYSIIDYSDNCDTALELIYQNSNNKYYLNCIKSDKILINFLVNNKIMTLKSALENNLISAEKIANEYPNILLKK